MECGMRNAECRMAGRGGVVWVPFPGRCPYMLSSVALNVFDSSDSALASEWNSGLVPFTEASVASRSERDQAGVRAGSAANPSRPSFPTPIWECLSSPVFAFLHPQDSETAAPAQGMAVACASSSCPRPVFSHQSVAQLEPHTPSAPNSNRCKSVGCRRKLVFVRMSQNTDHYQK